MASYTGTNFPETDATSIPIFLPRDQRDDLQPSIYVVTVHDPSTAAPKVQITSVNPGFGPRDPFSPPDTPPTDSYMHPAFYTSATGTVPTTADKQDWANAQQFVPRQNAHRRDAQPAKPAEQPTSTDFSTLAQLLEEIRQTQTCSHCHPAHQASSVKLKPTSLCYYHRQFGQAAKKCRQPCSYPNNQLRKTQ